MKHSYLGYKEFSNIDKLVTFSLPSAQMNGGNRIIVDESPNRRSVYQSVSNQWFVGCTLKTRRLLT